MKLLTNTFELIAGTSVAVGLRYLVFAGLAWVLCYVVFPRRWLHRKIVHAPPLSADVWREIRYSLITIVIFGTMGALTIKAIRTGWLHVYWGIETHGWAWFWLSIFCAILLHDAYFYWTHRLMHRRRFFRAFHRVHHLLHNPSPWAAYSFAPLESVVEAAVFPLAILVIPMHPYAVLIFLVWQLAFNVVGHTGYEYHPRWLIDSWLGKFFNTPTNHVMHHETMRGNYGLYFNFWDRLMGTNHPDYERRFREVTSRRRRANATTREARVSPEAVSAPFAHSSGPTSTTIK